MIRRLAILGWLGLGLCYGAPAIAQSPLQQEAEAALVAGDPARAAALSQQMIAQNPQSFAGLFLLALAQSDLGEQGTAARTAATAYAVAPDAAARVQAARLVASNRFSLGQYARAEFWLRRAANDVQTEAEAEAIVREYVRTIDANPVTLDFTAYIAPSDNINGGSEDGILRFEGIALEFLLPENRRALSGIEYAGSARLNYRIGRDDAQTTSLGVFLSSRNYILSSEARDLLDSSPNPGVRAVDGSDFATLQAEFGVTHQRNAFFPFGPTTFTLNLETFRQGGERLVDYRDTILNQDFRASRGTFGLRLSRRDQAARLETLVDEVTEDVIGSYRTGLPNGDGVRFSLAYRYSDAGFENTYEEYRAGLDYRRAEPIWGTRLGASIVIGRRSYDEFVTTLDGRRDEFASIGIDATYTEIDYFGFSPSVSISASRNESTAEEESNEVVQVLFGIESNF